jgi:hypothetical protein
MADKNKSLDYFFGNPEASLRAMQERILREQAMAAEAARLAQAGAAPQSMPQTFGLPPGFPGAAQQADVNRWVNSAPELMDARWRRPVTVGSDFKP